MAKLKVWCYGCEQEYTVTYTSKDEPQFCCFCSEALSEADKDDEEPQEWEMD